MSIRRKVTASLPNYIKAMGLKDFANSAAYVTSKGSAAVNGDAYYDTTDDEIKVYDSTAAAWLSVITSDSSGNVIIDGNLTVNGTQTVLNTATLDVEDVNITVNNGGNQASADDAAGITVEMSDATNATIIYDKDIPSRWKAGDVGSEIELANISSSQTLSNKTLDNSNAITVQDNTFTIQDNADNTKQLNLQLSGITPSTTRTLTVPDANDTIVGRATTDTLTNKTIDADNNTISNLAHGAEVDDPSSGVHGVTGSVVGTSDTQTLTNKTVVVANNIITTAASGNLASTELNAALAELQTDIDTRATSTDLTNHTNDTTTHGTTGDIVGTSDTQTLTNKTIDGNSNTLTVLAASQLSGAAPIANGGTGQTTASAAFNALAPTTTKGDIIAYSTTNARLAVGTDTFQLVADSAETTGLKWQSQSNHEVVSKTGAYTATASDRVILCDASGGDFTITLPASASSQGLTFIIKNTGATGIVTIDGNGAETIDGNATLALYKQYNYAEVTCDGSNWHIINKDLTDYREVEISSRPVTTVAGTHVQSSEALTLPPGKWIVGYSVPMRLTDASGASNSVISGAVTLHDGTTQVDGPGSIIVFAPLPANAVYMYQASGDIELNVTTSTSYSMDLVCYDSAASGSLRIEDTSADSGNGLDGGGVTNASKIFARRIG